ncbi:hypothetical protein AB4Z54_30240, partial [Streptomyces sp. MCAF7]
MSEYDVPFEMDDDDDSFALEDAEELIAQVIDDGDTSLELGHLSLPVVPASLAEATALTRLDLSDGTFTEVPGFLGDLTG